MTDYYKTLGISPDSDIETIKKAYRRRAIECHPDRGGSHEQMVLLNEAWEILSNPTTRANYDTSRLHAENQIYVRRAETDSRNANERAEQYPKDWNEFETWMDKTLNAVINDFKKAEYGEMWDGKLPTAGKSFTGWLFIILGGSLGLLTLVLIVAAIDYHGHIYMPFPLVFIAVGAWGGKEYHESLKEKLGKQKHFSRSKPNDEPYSPFSEKLIKKEADDDLHKKSWAGITLAIVTAIIFVFIINRLPNENEKVKSQETIVEEQTRAAYQKKEIDDFLSDNAKQATKQDVDNIVRREMMMQQHTISSSYDSMSQFPDSSGIYNNKDIVIRDRDNGDKYRGARDNTGYTRVKNDNGDTLRGYIDKDGYGRLTDDNGNDHRIRP